MLLGCSHTIQKLQKHLGDPLPKHRAKKRHASFLVAAIWIAVWYLAWAVIQQDILIASPGQVASRLAELVTQANFWVVTFSSLLRIVFRFSAGGSRGLRSCRALLFIFFPV